MLNLTLRVLWVSKVFAHQVVKNYRDAMDYMLVVQLALIMNLRLEERSLLLKNNKKFNRN